MIAARNGRVPQSPAEAFEARVTRSAGCWSWNGSKNAQGYGSVRLHCFGNRSVLAHRLSWLVHHGAIPDGAHVLHRCDNPECVRPDHLFTGSNADNIADRIAKGRPGSQVWKGRASPTRRLSADAISDIVANYRLEGRSHIAEKHGITAAHAWRVATGRYRHAP